MLPVTAGEGETRRQIFIYAILTVIASLAPVPLGFAGWLYAGVAAVMGVGFLRFAWIVRVSPGDHKAAMKLFGFSILYLFVLFATFIVETAIGIAPLMAAP